MDKVFDPVDLDLNTAAGTIFITGDVSTCSQLTVLLEELSDAWTTAILRIEARITGTGDWAEIGPEIVEEGAYSFGVVGMDRARLVLDTAEGGALTARAQLTGSAQSDMAAVSIDLNDTDAVSTPVVVSGGNVARVSVFVAGWATATVEVELSHDGATWTAVSGVSLTVASPDHLISVAAQRFLRFATDTAEGSALLGTGTVVVMNDARASGVATDVDLADVTYTPATAGDFADGDPGNADEAVDELAERLTDLLLVPQSGELTQGAPFGGGRKTGTITTTADRLFMHRFYSPARITWAAIHARIGVAVGGSALKVGIYENGTDGYPAAILYDGSAVPMSSAAAVDVSIAGLTILTEQKWYWIGILCSANAVEFVAAATYYRGAWADWPAGPTDAPGATLRNDAGNYAAGLPDPAPAAPWTVHDYTYEPYILLERS